MKKQINPSTKAHVLRRTLILFSLVAICTIPFALAQSRGHGTNNKSVANRSDEAQLRTNKGGAFDYAGVLETAAENSRRHPLQSVK